MQYGDSDCTTTELTAEYFCILYAFFLFNINIMVMLICINI